MKKLFFVLGTTLLVGTLSGTQAAPSIDPPGAITHGPRTSKMVALTFDADMTTGMQRRLQSGAVKSYNNVAVIDILKKTQTPATFFLTGLWTQVYPATARAIGANPLFQVESHSYDHPGFSQPCYGLPTIAQSQKKANLLQAQRAIALNTGVTPRLLRFPGGCAAAADMQLAHLLGLQVVGWDVVGGDVAQPNAAKIVQQTLSQVRGGSIVVLHSSGGHAPATAQALPQIIAGLKAKGLQPVKLQTLLAQR
ncbi:polysaccharide deacetylase family protein [Deinococcus sp. PESE-13]